MQKWKNSLVMNDNINLCELVRHCPKGEKFYCTSMEKEVEFLVVADNKIYVSNNGLVYAFSNNGKDVSTGEYLLLPSKYQPDWSKFKAPRFDPKTFEPFEKVLVKRDVKGASWLPNFFGKLVKEPKGGYSVTEVGSLFTWEICIPYNDETKRLVGTQEDCPDYYKWWEE